MPRLTRRVGGDGPVVAESSGASWRLIVRKSVSAAGTNPDALHEALRKLALDHPELAPDAFKVLCNCVGAWEDEYTEEHGMGALAYDDWLERIARGGTTIVTVDGELITMARADD